MVDHEGPKRPAEYLGDKLPQDDPVDSRVEPESNQRKNERIDCGPAKIGTVGADHKFTFPQALIDQGVGQSCQQKRGTGGKGNLECFQIEEDGDQRTGNDECHHFGPEVPVLPIVMQFVPDRKIKTYEEKGNPCFRHQGPGHGDSIGVVK